VTGDDIPSQSEEVRSYAHRWAEGTRRLPGTPHLNGESSLSVARHAPISVVDRHTGSSVARTAATGCEDSG
jgi:hypothetical protein